MASTDTAMERDEHKKQQQQQQHKLQNSETIGIQHNGVPAANTEIGEEVVDKQSSASGAKDKVAGMVKKLLIIKKILKWIYRIITSHCGLILMLIGYSFAGAYLFEDIEGPHEDKVLLERQEIIDNLTNSRDNLMLDFWNTSRNVSADREEWIQYATAELDRYTEAIRQAHDDGVKSNTTGDKVWAMPKTMIYVITIYTTIGYGYISPSTDRGRLWTVAYAAVGIPLCLIILADLGILLTRVLKFLWGFVRRLYYNGTCRKIRKVTPLNMLEKKLNIASTEDLTEDFEEEDSEDSLEFNLPPFLALSILIIYIFLGALMYRKWENWSYAEAFYFIFTSISTIGFGDILPDNDILFLVSSIYIFFGMALVSMVIAVLIEFFSKTIDEVKKKVNKLKMEVKRKMERLGNKMGIVSTEMDDGDPSRPSTAVTMQETVPIQDVENEAKGPTAKETAQKHFKTMTGFMGSGISTVYEYTLGPIKEIVFFVLRACCVGEEASVEIYTNAFSQTDEGDLDPATASGRGADGDDLHLTNILTINEENNDDDGYRTNRVHPDLNDDGGQTSAAILDQPATRNPATPDRKDPDAEKITADQQGPPGDQSGTINTDSPDEKDPDDIYRQNVHALADRRTPTSADESGEDVPLVKLRPRERKDGKQSYFPKRKSADKSDQYAISISPDPPTDERK